jgi:hypothetical protein
MSVESMADTAASFTKLPWHDSKLLGIQFERSESEGTDDIVFYILLRDSAKMSPCRVKLKDCQAAHIDIDLFGKRLCADDIGGGEGRVESSLKKAIEEKRRGDKAYPCRLEKGNLMNYIHFSIALVPPSGQIDIVAKTFELQQLETESHWIFPQQE